MQSPYGISSAVFRMKSFKLLLLAALSTTMLTGCERQFVSPIDPTGPSQTTEFAQRALLNLAETANERALVDLANAASSVAETLAVDDGTSVEPLFSKIAKLASAVTILERAFAEAGCEIELQKFAEVSMHAVRAFTIRNAVDMEQALQNLAREAMSVETIIGQFPVENNFIPFAFGYGLSVDDPMHPLHEIMYPDPDDRLYVPGVILIKYDNTIRPVNETKIVVMELLHIKGYTMQTVEYKDYTPIWLPLPDDAVLYQENYDDFESIDLRVNIDPLLIIRELSDIPGVAFVMPNAFSVDLDLPVPLLPGFCGSLDLAITKYNEAWCQGKFEDIDTILIERTGLDFFDYAFLRKLEARYVEEFNGTEKGIGIDGFTRCAIGVSFLEFYRYELSADLKTSLDMVVELYGQFLKSDRTSKYLCGYSILYDYYYLTTDYWKQLVTDHLNQ